jgi:hypothetical protein
MDDDTIRALVTRLARPNASGGEVIERAAILAAGADSTAVLSWIAAHDGEPEAELTAVAAGGLHGGRLGGRSGSSRSSAPRRYVLPPGVLG